MELDTGRLVNPFLELESVGAGSGTSRGLCGEVRPNPCDGLPHYLKGSILLPESCPSRRKRSPPNGREPLKLLDRNGSIVTVEGDRKGAVRFPSCPPCKDSRR